MGHIRPFVQIRGRPEFFEPVRHGLNTVGILLAPKDTGRCGKFGQSIDPTLQVVFSLLLITHQPRHQTATVMFVDLRDHHFYQPVVGLVLLGETGVE